MGSQTGDGDPLKRDLLDEQRERAGQRPPSGDSLRRYLLGELPEPERERVEERLLSDDDLYERLLLAEDDLIDEYVSGALDDQDQERFGRRFLRVPELRQDVKSVTALRKYARETGPQVVKGDSPAPPRFSLFAWLKRFFTHPSVGVSFAAASLAAVMLIAWLAAQVSQLQRQVSELQARQTPAPQTDLEAQLAAERLRNEQLSAELRRQQELLAVKSHDPQTGVEQPQPTPVSSSTPQPGFQTVIAFTLTPGAVRSTGELKKVVLSPLTRELRIRLDLAEDSYRGYRAVLRTGSREVLPSQSLRAVGGKLVTFRIPARLLDENDYEIVLSGVTSSGELEIVDRYHFRVSK